MNALNDRTGADAPRATGNVVIPIYNEEANLPELYRRLRSVFDAVPSVDWQVIYVSDGCRDRSVSIMLEQNAEDQRFTLLELSRNFGHQSALTAGIANADADFTVVMDGDLQDPPEVLPELVDAWRNGAKQVFAVRATRQDSGLRRMGFDLFHRAFGWLSDFPIQTDTGVFGLLDRDVVVELNKLGERNRFIPGLRSWVGFEQATVRYDRDDRLHGAPKQTLSRLLRYGADAIFSFSYKPLRAMTLSGAIISGFAALLGLSFVFKRLLGIETAQTGFTTLVSVILLLGGFQLVALGVLGEYLLRIYEETKQRPLFIVARKHGFGDSHRAQPEAQNDPPL